MSNKLPDDEFQKIFQESSSIRQLVRSCYPSDNARNYEKELFLQLDHINGDPSDNRLENLRFLCPNCHSQTPTYGGRKGKTGKHISQK